ncbi:beta-lactamase family protein [Flavobacterium sp. AC]|uniref:Beta-lactamase family protein n=1 Tax=Flavobacterium azizsancarii TaxID=2961580 RepID=A0ABT4WIE2_9FLAO|nr:serine hydrolase domain-containing protein [Flavobacterium azizsancarii]MDA6072331.1 beta-lactamase family protein [Flavobacterium azizsancarii]
MNSHFRISFLFSFILLFSNSFLFAQKKNNYAAQIDSLISVSDPIFNGVVLIAKNGKTVYNKTYGFTNFETRKRLKTDSQFEIMSNTRQITAVLILKEVEQGRIDLQAPIKKYLPELTQAWADSVTVHQLLNHTHGIIDLQKPLAFKPGTDFKYGDLGYSLLGEIIKSVTKKSYQEIANAFFKELKMKNTLCFSAAPIKNLVSGYINTNNSFKIVSKTMITLKSTASNGIVSTAGDLAIWNKNLHKGKLLQPESYQLLFKYNITAQNNFFAKEKIGYGYGFRIIDKEPVKYVGHTGLGDGFSSVNLYFPESDVSLIILENQMNQNRDLFYINEFKIKNILMKSDLLN